MISLSMSGAKFIGDWEGFRADPYNDTEDNATVGIGHKLHDGPVTPADRKRWGGMTYAHGLAQLQADMHANALAPLLRALKVPLTVAQVDALCSVGFNCGPGSLAPGKAIMTAVNSKPMTMSNRAIRGAWHQRVEAAIMKYAHPVVLTRRRRSEARLFSTGKYTKATGNQFANA